MSALNPNHGGARTGAGRPRSKLRQLQLQSLMDRAWSERQRLACVRKMNQLARKGDVRAFTILMAYAYGRPVMHAEINVNEISPNELLEYVMEEYNLTREQALPIVAKYFPEIMNSDDEMPLRDETQGLES